MQVDTFPKFGRLIAKICIPMLNLLVFPENQEQHRYL